MLRGSWRSSHEDPLQAWKLLTPSVVRQCRLPNHEGSPLRR